MKIDTEKIKNKNLQDQSKLNYKSIRRSTEF